MYREGTPFIENHPDENRIDFHKTNLPQKNVVDFRLAVQEAFRAQEQAVAAKADTVQVPLDDLGVSKNVSKLMTNMREAWLEEAA